MKERSILFSGPMVRALLDGTKTQTRRVMKPQPDLTPELNDCAEAEFYVGDECVHTTRCPYGIPGDRLWVRETHRPIYGQDCGLIAVDYRATYKYGTRLGDVVGIPQCWRPSIHMRREHSRITLEITGVRVQRLQEISEQDALAEGITDSWPAIECTSDRPFRDGYRWLWESINGAGSWGANPWVWALTFKRIRPEHSNA